MAVTTLVVLEVAEGLDDLLVEGLVICLDGHLPLLGVLFSRWAFSVCKGARFPVECERCVVSS